MILAIINESIVIMSSNSIRTLLVILRYHLRDTSLTSNNGRRKDLVSRILN